MTLETEAAPYADMKAEALFRTATAAGIVLEYSECAEHGKTLRIASGGLYGPLAAAVVFRAGELIPYAKAEQGRKARDLAERQLAVRRLALAHRARRANRGE